jgi:hypothetical protein
MLQTKPVLRGRRGVSMLFVLAAMLLLIAIGVSALTAAGANYGARLRSQTENQLNLYLNSMELTVRAMLEDRGDEGRAITDPMSTLTGSILKEAYGRFGQPNPPASLPLVIDLDDIDIPAEWGVTYTIKITGLSAAFTDWGSRNSPHINTVEAVEPELDVYGVPIPETGSPGSPAYFWVRESVSVSRGASPLIVEIEVTHTHRDETLRSWMEFNYAGSSIYGEHIVVASDIDERPLATIENIGTWTFRSRRIVN